MQGCKSKFLPCHLKVLQFDSFAADISVYIAPENAIVWFQRILKYFTREWKMMWKKKYKHPLYKLPGSEGSNQITRIKDNIRENTLEITNSFPDLKLENLFSIRPSTLLQKDCGIRLFLRILYNQKLPPEVFYKRRYSQKFDKIRMKTPVPRPLF